MVLRVYDLFYNHRFNNNDIFDNALKLQSVWDTTAPPQESQPSLRAPLRYSVVSALKRKFSCNYFDCGMDIFLMYAWNCIHLSNEVRWQRMDWCSLKLVIGHSKWFFSSNFSVCFKLYPLEQKAAKKWTDWCSLKLVIGHSKWFFYCCISYWACMFNIIIYKVFILHLGKMILGGVSLSLWL